MRRIRCTIYTRKSSEDGLEQDFNSLDAQREACEPISPARSMRDGSCFQTDLMMAAYPAGISIGRAFSG